MGCRPFQMRQDALSSSSDRMESARLPSHVRCSPTIEGRPRTFTFFRRWMVGGQRRRTRHRCRLRKRAGGGSAMLGWIRLVRNAVRCWLAYLKSVRPALKRGLLIVGDRWMYGYIVQPDAMKFHGPDLLARAVLRLLPRPHLIVNLAAPAHVIRGRKQELTLSQIEQELLAWSSLRVPNFKTLDATRSPQDIAIEILVALASAGRTDCVA